MSPRKLRSKPSCQKQKDGATIGKKDPAVRKFPSDDTAVETRNRADDNNSTCESSALNESTAFGTSAEEARTHCEDNAAYATEEARTRGRSSTRKGRRRPGENIASSSPRLRHPQNPTSPESAYRNAVQAFLGPTVVVDATNGYTHPSPGDSKLDHQHVRSLTPTVRNKWCSPASPKTGSSSAPRHSAASSPAATKEGVPPLLLSPSKWGIGLKGEWVPADRLLTTREAGQVSLTWKDIRGNTLLHLAAQHNDVSLIKAVLECEKRRKDALETRNKRRERVSDRARKWAEHSEKEVAAKKLSATTVVLSSKEIARRIKEQRGEEESTDFKNVKPSGTIDSETGKDSPPKAVGIYFACRDWLPLEATTGKQAQGRGAALARKLRAMLEEAHLKKVARLAAMYMEGDMNEADWYHRTEFYLRTTDSKELLVEIAAAYPSDSWERRMKKEAVQEYTKEERSNANGGYWMDRGIADALDLNARNRLLETPLILGAQNGSLECVAALLKEADTDVAAVNDDSRTRTEEDGCTALVMATMLNKTPVAKILIAAYVERGVGVDHRTAKGFSALHWAVLRGNADIAIDLVDAGASINAGRTSRRQALWRLPIHKCAEYGSIACLKVLQDAKADPLSEDKMGMTPMHIAASKGFLEMMRFLSEGELAVSFNVVSKKNNRTPLHYAVEYLQLEAARLILGSSDESEGSKLLGGSQRTKLDMMLTAAAREERGFISSGFASLSEFVQKVFL